MKRIVVAYDGSTDADRALRRAADVAEAFAARMVVVSITNSRLAGARELIPPAPEPLGLPGVAAAPGPVPVEVTPVAPESSDLSAELADQQVERARSALLGRFVDAEYVSETGDPGERVLEAAEDVDADLIVVGSRDRGFLGLLLGRSLDEKVIRGADRDVLVVH
jgi:nucleotide-binding universal stress UspA family protein